MEDGISLLELVDIIKKRLWLIIMITIVATTASGLVSYFLLTPVYQTSTELLVKPKTEQNVLVPNDISLNSQIINTYTEIIKSPAVLEEVSNELNLNRDLSSQITVTTKNESQILLVTVNDTDPVLAKDIANTVASVFQRELVNIMNIDNVNILSKAEDGKHVEPNPVMNMAIAFVIGLMIGVGLAFLLDYFDKTIKNEQDVERYLESPVLGSITLIENDDVADKKGSTKMENRMVRGDSRGA
ncbi:YveK family protein [Metabacillus schmidteae]|uniref:YveK family protein n=1 Tax=Metabacillus schmidteae TaxID=2730405 RepID=UPI00158AD14E